MVSSNHPRPWLRKQLNNLRMTYTTKCNIESLQWERSCPVLEWHLRTATSCLKYWYHKMAGSSKTSTNLKYLELPETIQSNTIKEAVWHIYRLGELTDQQTCTEKKRQQSSHLISVFLLTISSWLRTDIWIHLDHIYWCRSTLLMSGTDIELKGMASSGCQTHQAIINWKFKHGDQEQVSILKFIPSSWEAV